MKIHVVFEFPDVKDVESTEADYTLECLSDDLKKYAGGMCEWYIDDVTE
jgi:hypothetical protein